MKYLFYTLFYSFSFFTLNAQSCLPDSTYKDSTAGVYPKPITLENPNGGINKRACIDKPYDFTFTVVVPDSVLVPLSPNPIALEKVAIETKNAIKNLPNGIGYECNPPDCVFRKNTIGCLILKGTPDNTNTPGDFKPIIKLKLTINVGIPIDYSTEYPGTVFPGEYILTLQEEPNCISANNDLNIPKAYWYPNPSNGKLSSFNESINLVKIYNINGKLMYSDKHPSTKSLDLSDFEGIHFIHWIENNKKFVQKILIHK